MHHLNAVIAPLTSIPGYKSWKMQTMRITIAFTVKKNVLSARALFKIIARQLPVIFFSRRFLPTRRADWTAKTYEQLYYNYSLYCLENKPVLEILCISHWKIIQNKNQFTVLKHITTLNIQASRFDTFW